MKFIKTIYAIVFVLIFTSCSTEGWKQVGGLIDYGISYWEQNTDPNSYDHTSIDAWKSGTGGKFLAASEAAVALYGEFSNKDVSKIQQHIRNASSNLTKDNNFNSSDFANIIGAGCFSINEITDAHSERKFEELKSMLTDPNNPYYNEEEALKVEYFDDENRRVVWKPDYIWVREVMELRKSKNDKWVADNLEKVSNITLEEYNNLPKEMRQEVDMKILAYEDSKSQSEPAEIVETPIVENPQKVDYKSLIEGVVVSDYDINSYKLSAEQEDLLKKIGELLKEDESLGLIICGNTCSLGSKSVNYKVGLKRAEEAKNYLVALGIDAERIEVISYGYTNPVADNSTLEGRKSNRRLTFKLK